MPPSPRPSATGPDDGSSPTVSVVIPALDAAESLPSVLGALPPVDEVIVVDGGSGDDTVAAARAARPDVYVLPQTRPGRGNALLCGFAASTGDIVVTLNADGSTDPGEIPRYVDALLAGADVAHGSRYRDGSRDLDGGRLERIGAAVLSLLVDRLFGIRLTDPGRSSHACWREVLADLDLPPAHLPARRRADHVWGDGPEIDPLLVIRMAAHGLRIVEVAGVGYPHMHGGQRRGRARRAVRALRTLIVEYLRHRRTGRRPNRQDRPARPARRDIAGVVPAPRKDVAPARPSPAIAPAAPPPQPDPVPRVPGGRSTGRHAVPAAGTVPARRPRPAHPTEVSMDTHPTGHATGAVPPTGRDAERMPVDRRRGYPGPRPPWAPREPGTHRTVDVHDHDTGLRGGRVYDTGAHHLPDEDTGVTPFPVRRSGLYDTGVHRLGVYDSGVHRTDVYDTGAHHLPDESGPLYRTSVPREVGGGRRRLDARDRRPDGRPDLTVIPGEGWASDRGTGRPNHLRAVPGERKR